MLNYHTIAIFVIESINLERTLFQKPKFSGSKENSFTMWDSSYGGDSLLGKSDVQSH
jgi:hypothetical protein